ncbi:MAG TPA: deoxyguanosinetriphosphate triphosphohydrolase [Candidatus Acidoferrales bacterium]|jgi:dGTPase|nr:deoxyguanosinetriphosphate triphosphohydrolase [Candidatus Acidoferrales bacterium]
MAFASYAMDATKSRGRRYPETPHPYRKDYARDRDRVIHSRAFRRLEAKTQVFTTRYSDHFRNRLTHTLEVAQIARTVAGALQLNADLAEALALVHDIGHPPFGHAGEHKLDELLRPHGDRFNHNLQALRLVEQLEQRYLDFPGLNLTFEVREGIVKHSRDYDVAKYPELSEYLLVQRPPLEAQLIDFVDEIAYNTADLDDGYEAKLLDIEMICAEVPLFARFYDEVERTHPRGPEKLKFNAAAKRVLDHLATGLIENTRSALAASGVQSVDEVRRAPRRLAGFSQPTAFENAALKKLLHTHLYNNPAIVSDRERSVEALAQLFDFYVQHPDAMPKAHAELAQRSPSYRVVCDYIAGMTDHYLLRQHAELLGTSSVGSP